ncbi:14564_t:CDS:1, partial [Entrophospora sp. SA101]
EDTMITLKRAVSGLLNQGITDFNLYVLVPANSTAEISDYFNTVLNSDQVHLLVKPKE